MLAAHDEAVIVEASVAVPPIPFSQLISQHFDSLPENDMRL